MKKKKTGYVIQNLNSKYQGPEAMSLPKIPLKTTLIHRIAFKKIRKQNSSLKKIIIIIIRQQHSTWQCCTNDCCCGLSSLRNLLLVVDITLRLNCPTNPNWHSFSTRAQSRLDPIHAIAKTAVSAMGAREHLLRLTCPAASTFQEPHHHHSTKLCVCVFYKKKKSSLSSLEPSTIYTLVLVCISLLDES